MAVCLRTKNTIRVNRLWSNGFGFSCNRQHRFRDPKPREGALLLVGKKTPWRFEILGRFAGVGANFTWILQKSSFAFDIRTIR